MRGIANALSYALTQVRPDPSDERVSQKKRTEQMIQWETDLFAVSMALQLATGYDDTAFRRKCQGPKDRGENP